jgi:NAD(P)-dependent dehydrogenase (short-subunit alcohol dehydrogenase family)
MLRSAGRCPAIEADAVAAMPTKPAGLLPCTVGRRGNVDILVTPPPSGTLRRSTDSRSRAPMRSSPATWRRRSVRRRSRACARGYGRIVDIASTRGLVASVGKAAFAAAEHTVVGLTRVTAPEAAKSLVAHSATTIDGGWTAPQDFRRRSGPQLKPEAAAVHRRSFRVDCGRRATTSVVGNVVRNLVAISMTTLSG